MNWMLLISLLLFWLPGVGPFIAGLVGGKKAGGVGSAVVAVFLPIVLLSATVIVLGSLLIHIPLFGALIGLGVFTLLVLHVGPLLLGAIIGGLVASAS
jgi:hypothetical protein